MHLTGHFAISFKFYLVYVEPGAQASCLTIALSVQNIWSLLHMDLVATKILVPNVLSD